MCRSKTHVVVECLLIFNDSANFLRIIWLLNEISTKVSLSIAIENLSQIVNKILIEEINKLETKNQLSAP